MRLSVKAWGLLSILSLFHNELDTFNYTEAGMVILFIMTLRLIWNLISGIKSEALPGVWGNRGNRAFISGEQGNKDQLLRWTGEQRQYWGTGNIRKQIFHFWGTGEQANLFQGNKETGTPPPPPHPWEGLKSLVFTHWCYGCYLIVFWHYQNL